MIRFTALNDNSQCLENDETSEIQIAKEAQESIAEAEYLRALTLLSKGENDIAHSLFSQLLDTQVLNDISKNDIKLSAILYNCHKNLAFICEEKEDFDGALSNYASAINIDYTDINTLFRLGQLSLKLNRLELAEYAFQSCLKQNSKHLAAANGLLSIYSGRKNILAIYELAVNINKQKINSQLVKDKICEQFQKFSFMIPFCKSLYGSYPDQIQMIQNNHKINPSLNSNQSEKYSKNASECKNKLITIKLHNMNFLSFGKFILSRQNYYKSDDRSLASMLNNFYDFCGNTYEELNADEKAVVSHIEIKGGSMEPSYIDDEKKSHASDSTVEMFETDADGNFMKMDDGKLKPKRRCSDLKLLEQWGWHKNRKYSSRKKTQQDRPELDHSLRGFLNSTFSEYLGTSFDNSDMKDFIGKTDDHNCEECSKLQSFKAVEPERFEQFLKSLQENRMDILSLNFVWLSFISTMWQANMPNDLKNIYIELYSLYIEIFGLPTWNMADTAGFHKSLIIQLFFIELQYDMSIKTQSILPKLWMETLNNIKFLFGSTIKELNDLNDLLSLRILNVEFLKYCANFDNENCLKQIDFGIEILKTKDKDFCVHLPNLESYCISINNWGKKRSKIERKTKLKQIPLLYKNCQWHDLCENLKEQLTNKINICGDPDELYDYKSLNELLLQCLWNREEFEDCLMYAESFLHYSTQSHLQESNNLWIESILFSISYIESILLSEGNDIVIGLKKHCSRLVQNLINILTYQFDDEAEKQSYFGDEIKMRGAWIILHRILLREENLKELTVEDGSFPLSFKLLFTAHEHIGKKQSCTNDNGEFLQYIIQTILPNLHAPIYSFCKNDVLEYIEQITFCLYKFPPKKARSRYLEDHNSISINLTLANAVDIFDIYSPEILPELNSYKGESITSDMEQFLHKILGLLTFDLSPGIIDVNNIISGAQISSTSSDSPHLPFKIKTIYYLLADYYFKSHDFLKAIKFYVNDLAVNPTRFDSWAGISLSKASIIETKVNGLFPADQFQFLLECDEVTRCFDKCILLSQNHILIWIEYGSFAYFISSYCSRNLKQINSNHSLLTRSLLEKKEAMLDIAYKCFSVAATLQSAEPTVVESYEEKWLCQYMLGKISEKKYEDPSIYLNHYLTASNFLYECNATYPIKINHNNPTTLSVEALEVFYRTNAAIIKFLEKCSEIPRQTGNLFKGVLKQLSKSPFAFNKAKIDGASLYAIKRKCNELPTEASSCAEKRKNQTQICEPVNANTLNPEPTPVIEVLRSLSSEDSRATVSNSTNSSSSSNYDTESENSNNQSEPNLTEEEIEQTYIKVIRNLEECAIRFPEHYKSIYRIASFYMNGPKKAQDYKLSENLLLHHYQTGVGNVIDGLFYDRKPNNIFNGIWRIPSSEIDRPGSFSTHLVKCVEILIQLLRFQSNYKLIIEIIIQLQKSPENDKRYIMDSDRIRLYESAINCCKEIIRTITRKITAEENRQELLNLLLDIYKLQKKYYKYNMQKDTWLSVIFVEVYLSYIQNTIDHQIHLNINYFDLAVRFCHQQVNYKKNIEKQKKMNELSYN